MFWGGYRPYLGTIEIGDNVFVGARTIIMYNVKIGSNCIIGAGSVVTKDIPNNSVAVGIPAKVIGSYEDIVKKYKKYSYNFKNQNLFDDEVIDKVFW